MLIIDIIAFEYEILVEFEKNCIMKILDGWNIAILGIFNLLLLKSNLDVALVYHLHRTQRT